MKTKQDLEHFLERNMDDGYGKPFRYFEAQEKESILSELYPKYLSEGRVKIRDKYVVVGGDNLFT